MGRCRQEGGTNAGKMVRNIWSFLFATFIQKLMSWSGQNEKFEIGDSPLFSLVQGKARSTRKLFVIFKLDDRKYLTDSKNEILLYFSDTTLLAFPSTTSTVVADVTKTFFQNVSNRKKKSTSSASKTRKTKKVVDITTEDSNATNLLG